MKAARTLFAAAFLLLSVSAAVTAADPADAGRAMRDAAREEIGILSTDEASPEALGEWKDIIESSLFLLFRRTELYRGGMRILVVDSPSVLVKLYPDGTFVLSTALLDYIDASLFESAADSPRRMRNFNAEREAMLIPFLVPEAAHFALGHSASAFARNSGGHPVPGMHPFLPSADEVLEADRFSPVLLAVAGLDPLLFDVSLASLGEIYASSRPSLPFADYLASLPSPSVRAASIAGSRDKLAKIAAEFSSVLAALKTGTALNEAADSLAALGETWPGSPYVTRLEALVQHRQWLDTVPVSAQRVKTFFPAAAEEDPSTAGFVSLLDEKKTAFPAPRTIAKDRAIPGDARLYEAAIGAYKKTADAYSDSGLASSYAMLRYWSDANAALALAESSAAEERGSRDFTARANLASLLYLTGTDYPRAQYLLDTLPETSVPKTGLPSAPAARPFLLDRGFPGDERDLLLNSALILASLGDGERSLARKSAFERLSVQSRNRGTIPFRLIYSGDTADELVAKWGRPAEIIYNYVTENWNYPSLSASVYLLRGSGEPPVRTIGRIRFGALSPLTPGGDVRVGDGRQDFEAAFGKPAYKAGDCEVYLKDGNRISVFFLADTVRGVTAGL